MRSSGGANNNFHNMDNDLSARLKAIWEDVLGIDEIKLTDNFFDLGGDYRKIVLVADRLQSHLRDYIYPVALYDAPTLAGLAAYLQRHYPRTIKESFESVSPYDFSGPAYTTRINHYHVALARQWITPLPSMEAVAGLPGKKNPSAIFILSAPRSGSTLLRVMLAGNPGLFAPPELNLLNFNTLGERKAACSTRYRFMLEGAIRAVMALKGCDANRAVEILAQYEKQDLSAWAFYRLLQEWMGVRTLVDKTTAYTLDIETLKRAEAYFDKACYIHLVRHPGGMVHSVGEVRFDRLFFRGAHPFAPEELGQVLWVISNQNILKFLSGIPSHRQHRVLFEELVREPKQTVRDICRFLGLEFHPEMLNPYEDGAQKMTDGVHLKTVGDPKFLQHDTIRISIADRWKEDGLQASLGEEALEIAEDFGYPRIPDPGSLDAEPREALDHSWQDGLVHKMFEAQVGRTPNQVALEFEGRQLTYRELNQSANQLAHYLLSLGVGPEVPVGICVERSIEMIIGILGILKAGGVYVPIDPAYPKNRLAFMLADIEAAVLLTLSELLDDLPICSARIVCLDSGQGTFSQESREDPVSNVNPENTAYVIYTSGSSGEPKGVVVEHRAAARHFGAMRDAFRITPKDRVLQFTSLNFDVSLEQVFVALLSGASLILRGKQIWGKDEFYQKLSELDLTVINLPAGYWAQVCDAAESRSTLYPNERLRLVIIGSDVILPECVKLWQRSPLGRAQLMNAYGPTESVITSMLYSIPPGYFESRPLESVPIGYPVNDRWVYILDRDANPVSRGEVGEICIGGPLLARGYLNRPDLTADRFTPDPFSDQPGARMYRTGDLARYLPGGEIDFLGRMDAQLKIQSIRVEPGEIEAALRRHPMVVEAVALPKQHPSGITQLVAYVVQSSRGIESGSQAAYHQELRNFLAEILPAYMLPSSIISIEAMPLTLSGEIDERALPIPEEWISEPSLGSIAAMSSMEQTVASIWQAFLGVEVTDLDVNFFDLGGHSLQVVQVHSKLCEVLERDIPITDLFRYTTVSALAGYLSRGDGERGSFPDVKARAEKRKARFARRVPREG